MSKKTSDSGKPAIEKLLAEGILTLTAQSRDEINEQAEALIAAIPGDTNWTSGCVEFNSGTFSKTFVVIKD